MTPVEWAAVGAALTGLVGALGDQAPGVIITLVMGFAYWQREKQIQAERDEWLKCKTDSANEIKGLLDRVFAIADAANDALNSVAVNLAAMNRNSKIGDRLAELEQRIEQGEEHDTPGRRRPIGRKAG